MGYHFYQPENSYCSGNHVVQKYLLYHNSYYSHQLVLPHCCLCLPIDGSWSIPILPASVPNFTSLVTQPPREFPPASHSWIHLHPGASKPRWSDPYAAVGPVPRALLCASRGHHGGGLPSDSGAWGVGALGGTSLGHAMGTRRGAGGGVVEVGAMGGWKAGECW